MKSAVNLHCLVVAQVLLLAASVQAQSFAVAPTTPRELQQLFHHTGERLPLVSAHRGGSGPGLPENCIATFERTLQTSWAIMEIDPRMTKDGQIVVHHDATLNRTTSGRGPVAEHTLAQLQKLRLRDPAGNTTEYSIPTLREVLRWARGKTVLVLDQKDVSVADRVKAIERERAETYAMLIVYSFDDAKECHRLNPQIMMEVMIPTQAKFREFERTGVPWSNVIAFVGHEPPTDRELLSMLHAKGVMCMAGTSRNLDRELLELGEGDTTAIRERYQALLALGIDLIETDVPRELAPLLFGEAIVPAHLNEVLVRTKQ